jgi:Integrase zinc binding domain
VEFLQGYTFHIKHKSGASNQVADALSRRHSLLSTMKIIKEDHDGGLSSHFGQDKTGALLQDRFYWLKMMKDGKNEPNSWASSFQPGENDGDQVMIYLQVNNHDQGNIFWTSSLFEEPGPSHIYN